ncbi:YbfB/YjiJ family MFS transporter [Tardiphaga alba]|uniref:YbfB/YjiJ family MFS transporter n=2 Tax=Tardiphaga alba TaxID=340268 RepID=A0ABX8AJ64_9BRAD|nr:YbfB/YjiJ family MFS transporter [Tardiphaga alba]
MWRWACAGLSASFVGIGLARFAYTPLVPALIAAKWFAASDVIYFGAINLVAYFIGAAAARPLAARFGAVPVLRASMVSVVVACLACAVPLSFTWYLVWRIVPGIAGGLIMVLAASTILPHVAASRRGLVGGLVFVGVGLGAAASGTLVPLLLREGLAACWIGFAVLSALLTAASWRSWPRETGEGAHADPVQQQLGVKARRLNRSLIAEYGLVAFAMAPHTIFLVDYVARQLGLGINAGAGFWVLFGCGAVIGPLVTGRVADKIGFGRALTFSYALLALAIVALPLGTHMPALPIISSVVVGGFTPGIVPLALGRVHELVPGDPARQRAIWGRAVTCFAGGQAAGAYGLSILLAHGVVSYATLFVLAAAAAVLALALNLMTALTVRE